MSKEIGSYRNAANLFSRVAGLAHDLEDREFRHGYMARHIRAFLAAQIRALRGKKSQTEFGEEIGKPQSVVSRLENESYGKVSVSTLIDIAQKLDVGLIIRFVDFPTFLRYSNDVSEEALAPAQYNSAAIRGLLTQERNSVAGLSGLIPEQIDQQVFGSLRDHARMGENREQAKTRDLGAPQLFRRGTIDATLNTGARV